MTCISLDPMLILCVCVCVCLCARALAGCQSEALDPGMSVMETLVKAAPDAVVNDIKALLGRMLFPKAAMEKKVGGLCVQTAGVQMNIGGSSLLELD